MGNSKNWREIATMPFWKAIKEVRWMTWKEDFREGFESLTEGVKALGKGLWLVISRALMFPLNPILKPVMFWKTRKRLKKRLEEERAAWLKERGGLHED